MRRPYKNGSRALQTIGQLAEWSVQFAIGPGNENIEKISLELLNDVVISDLQNLSELLTPLPNRSFGLIDGSTICLCFCDFLQNCPKRIDVPLQEVHPLRSAVSGNDDR